MGNISDIHLHIISFDVPFPANYGGVIDVFCKAKALTEKGIKVHLHCFEYGGKRSPELQKMFYDVQYYKMDMSKRHLLNRTPFIVETRRSQQLIQNLLQDDYPILMEGLHTTALLRESQLQNRRLIVRTHNIEHVYYRNLSKVEKNLVRKVYFLWEAAKLKKYENILSRADHLLTISQTDDQYFSARYKSVIYLPAFHSYTNVVSHTGRGKYVLYHGNLSIPENTHAVKILLNTVFKNSEISFKIAGLDPPAMLRKMAASNPLTEIIASPDDQQLNGLIQNAHVNVLFTGQATGLKLKLLNALYNGRFVLANNKMVHGSNLEKLCEVADTPDEMKRLLPGLMKKDFTTEMKRERQEYLQGFFTTENNVKRLIELIV